MTIPGLKGKTLGRFRDKENDSGPSSVVKFIVVSVYLLSLLLVMALAAYAFFIIFPPDSARGIALRIVGMAVVFVFAACQRNHLPHIILTLLPIAALSWLSRLTADFFELSSSGRFIVFIAFLISGFAFLVALIAHKEHREAISNRPEADDWVVEKDILNIVKSWRQRIDTANLQNEDRADDVPESLARLIADLEQYAERYAQEGRERRLVLRSVEKALEEADVPTMWPAIASVELRGRWGL